ncbi:LCP family protein [Micrococcus sp.]|uniref:LCP family protein n=1 Tax=Micrococcus sp. TaxID=1271 RepID=UPI002A91D0AE|nr:LCP family protein [Micrococcus sp.]MDY6055666.1 LCP family protein [Micrococcus sp.]
MTAPEAPRAHGSRSARPQRRRRPLLILLAVLLALLLAVVVAVAVFLGGLSRAVDEGVERFPSGAFPAESMRPGEDGCGADGSASGLLATPTAPAPGQDPAQAGVLGPEAPCSDGQLDTQAVDVLLVGEDSGIEGRDEAGRSDTLMWVHVPGDRSEVKVMSIMRDLWVPIPGHGDAKVNAAYRYGGVPLTVSTAENMLQARVDHVIAVDMAGFQGLVDALGGVTVQNPRAFHSGHMGGHDFPQGAVTLDGEAALAYARERYNLPRSDFDRVENQQRLVTAIIQKAVSMDTLANPGRVQESVQTFAPFLTLDDSLDSLSLAALVWDLRDARSAPIETSTLPSLGVGTTADDQDVVFPDWAGIRRIGKEIRTGQDG